MRNRSWLILLVTLAGCTLGPHYNPPYVDNPDDWRVTLKDADGSVNVDWWYQFDDDVLVHLIDTSLWGNQDLLAAKYRVDEFLGLYRVTRADLYPQIAGNAEYCREKISSDITQLFPGVKNPENIYQVLLTGTWEIDIWGKLRRATEAACRDLLAAEENRLTVVQTLVSSVALAYINLLKLDRQLEIAIETAKSRGKTLELFQKRFAAGVISKIDLSQIESQYQEALATIPDFEQRIERQENAICILMGENPGRIPRGRTLHTLTLPEIPSDIPSHLLLQRPDLRAAEQELAAATARIAVARAEYFPTLSLTGAYGASSNELSTLFTSGANVWNYCTPVTMPIFTAGKIAGQVKATEAFRNQLLATYRQRILEALQDVNDSLIVFQKRREQEEEQRKQVESLQVYARLARLRYDEGYASYLEVLDAERSLFNVQLQYSETYANLFQALVALYRSLGGGWIYIADPMTECYVDSQPVEEYCIE